MFPLVFLLMQEIAVDAKFTVEVIYPVICFTP